jgi:hypothetical protein
MEENLKKLFKFVFEDCTHSEKVPVEDIHFYLINSESFKSYFEMDEEDRELWTEHKAYRVFFFWVCAYKAVVEFTLDSLSECIKRKCPTDFMSFFSHEDWELVYKYNLDHFFFIPKAFELKFKAGYKIFKNYKKDDYKVVKKFISYKKKEIRKKNNLKNRRVNKRNDSTVFCQQCFPWIK